MKFLTFTQHDFAHITLFILKDEGLEIFHRETLRKPKQAFLKRQRHSKSIHSILVRKKQKRY